MSMDFSDVDTLFQNEVKSDIMPRWERKQKALTSKTPKSARRTAELRSTLKSKTPGKTPSKAYECRFMPKQSNSDLMTAHLNNQNNENCAPDNNDNRQSQFQSQLAASLFQGDDMNSRILAFKEKAPAPSEGHHNNLRVLYTQNKDNSFKVKKTHRFINSTPERILDAPDMLDDYYLNLLDWSSNNALAVCLGSAVYLWDAATGGIEQLMELPEDNHDITSVSFMADGSHIAVGTSNNDVQLWNVELKKQVRSMKGHAARVGSLAWNNHILSSGSRDSTIINHDVRIAQHATAVLRGHEQEICGLKWSPDGSQLASGGNDNMACIWDVNNTAPRHILRESKAAVKALAWCPFQKNLLATGGGTADRHIRFYNSLSGEVVNQIDTNSQVTSLLWSKTEKEIISSHGFSQNQLCVWKYPTMAKVSELTGHTSRILHTALSADGTTVCSAAADETLRFWKVWDVKKKRSRTAAKSSSSKLSTMKIR